MHNGYAVDVFHAAIPPYRFISYVCMLQGFYEKFILILLYDLLCLFLVLFFFFFH